MFVAMQQEYNRLTKEYEEAVRAAGRYQEEVHHKKEVLANCSQSLIAAVKEKDYHGWETDRAKVDLEQAKAAL